MILRNHGLLTVGSTVDEAAYLFMLMEKSCQIQLAADAAAASGRQKVNIDDEAARFTFENTSEAVSTPNTLSLDTGSNAQLGESIC